MSLTDLETFWKSGDSVFLVFEHSTELEDSTDTLKSSWHFIGSHGICVLHFPALSAEFQAQRLTNYHLW